MAKPAAVYIDGVENAVLHGVLPSRPPVVLGCSGVVRVLEAGRDGDDTLSGELVVVQPFTSRGVLGVDADGLLQQYPCIPADSVLGVVEEASVFNAVLYWLLLGVAAAEEIGARRAVVVGAGLSGLAAAVHLGFIGGEPVVYTLRRRGFVRKIGVDAVSSPSDLHGVFDAAYIASLSPRMAEEAVGLVGDGGVVVYNPFIRVSTATRGKVSVVTAEPRMGLRDKAYRVWRVLRRLIRVVEVEKPGDAVGLFPVPGVGGVVAIG